MLLSCVFLRKRVDHTVIDDRALRFWFRRSTKLCEDLPYLCEQFFIDRAMITVRKIISFLRSGRPHRWNWKLEPEPPIVRILHAGALGRCVT